MAAYADSRVKAASSNRDSTRPSRSHSMRSTPKVEVIYAQCASVPDCSEKSHRRIGRFKVGLGCGRFGCRFIRQTFTLFEKCCCLPDLTTGEEKCDIETFGYLVCSCLATLFCLSCQMSRSTSIEHRRHRSYPGLRVVIYILDTHPLPSSW